MCLAAGRLLRVIPESARWLLTKGRTDEAMVLLCKAAQTNSCQLLPSVQVATCFIGATLLFWMVCYTGREGREDYALVALHRSAGRQGQIR